MKLTTLENRAEKQKMRVEELLPKYTVKVQKFFRAQMNQFFNYLFDNRNILKPNLSEARLNRLIYGFNWDYYDEQLSKILNDNLSEAIEFGFDNAIENTLNVIKMQNNFKQTKDAAQDTLEIINGPEFAHNALEYLDDRIIADQASIVQLSKNIDTYTSRTIMQELRMGINKMEDMDQLAARVQKVFNEATQSRALMIARTETMRSFNQGTLETYRLAKITEAQWLISNDERTCEVCLHYDGVVMPVNEAQMMIPVHPRCRCTWIPVVGETILPEPPIGPITDFATKNPNFKVSQFFIKKHAIKLPKKMPLNQRIKVVQKKLIDSNKNTMVAIDNNGNVILNKIYDRKTLKLTKKDLSILRGKDATLVNNHSTFKSIDIDFLKAAREAKAKQIIYVDKRYIDTMTFNNQFYDDAFKNIDDLWNSINNELRQMDLDGILTSYAKTNYGDMFTGFNSDLDFFRLLNQELSVRYANISNFTIESTDKFLMINFTSKAPTISVNSASRGHLDIHYTEDAVEQFMKDYKGFTGQDISYEDALQYYKAANKYSSNSEFIRKAQQLNKLEYEEYLKKTESVYSKISYEDAKRMGDLLDELVRIAPKYDDDFIYRGIGNARQYFESANIGDIIDMRGVSSFSSEQRVAFQFQNMNKVNPNDTVQFVVRNGVDFSSSIRHMATFKGENEVLVSSLQKFRIVQMKTRLNDQVGEYLEVVIEAIK